MASDLNMNSVGVGDGGEKGANQATPINSLLLHLNKSVREQWKVRGKFALQNLIAWCCHDGNFVSFTHFWLSTLTRSSRENYMTLQYDCLHQELSLGLEHSTDEDYTLPVLQAVLPEYPRSLFNTKTYTFLDTLHELRLQSLNTVTYKLPEKLLTNVTQNVSGAEAKDCLEETRSFCVIMLWCSAISLYHKLMHGYYLSFETTDHDWPSDRELTSQHQQQCDVVEAFQSVEGEYSDVIEYMARCGRLSMDTCVNQEGETLLHQTVKLQKCDMLKYILRKLEKHRNQCGDRSGCDVINQADRSGSTALHLACQLGNKDVVALLLSVPNIQIDVTNDKMDHATPLHVAALHGHVTVVKLLLSNGANINMKMGGQTAFDLANQLQHQPLLGTLKRRFKDLF